MNKIIIKIKARLPKLYKFVISPNRLYALIIRRNKGEGNQIRTNCSYLRKSIIKVDGDNNTINLENSFFSGLKVNVYGSNNTVIIEENCIINDLELWIEDNDNTILIGSCAKVNGYTHIACIEGCEVSIGSNSLFSEGITIRVGDSHSIISEGKRINASESVSIGNHVWIGNGATILKGVNIGSDSIIGTGAIVTKNVPNNCAVAGNPAKVIKSNVTWDIQRLKINN